MAEEDKQDVGRDDSADREEQASKQLIDRLSDENDPHYGLKSIRE